MSEKTVEQIGKALNELGRFADGYGQKIRLEVHGSCSPLPIMKAIMDVADHPNVGACWNCNATDLDESGSIEQYFELLKPRMGHAPRARSRCRVPQHTLRKS